MREKIQRLVILFLSIYFFPFITSSYGEKSALKKVTWATPTTPGSMSAVPFEVAIKKGFYTEERLDFEIIPMKSTLAVVALKNGNVDFVGSAGTSIRTAAIGLPIKIIFVVTKSLPHALMTKPQIKKGQDLKGKVIGVSTIGSSEHFGAMKIVERFGLNPKKDVTFITVGPGEMAYVALLSGSVDGCMVSSPQNTVAERKGFIRIMDVADVYDTPSIGLTVRDETLKKDRDLAKRAIRGTLKGLVYVKTHRDEIAESLMKNLGIDKELAYEHHAYMVKTYTNYGRSSDEGINNILETARDEGALKEWPIPLSKIADFSLVEEVRKEMGIK